MLQIWYVQTVLFISFRNLLILFLTISVSRNLIFLVTYDSHFEITLNSLASSIPNIQGQIWFILFQASLKSDPPLEEGVLEWWSEDFHKSIPL